MSYSALGAEVISFSDAGDHGLVLDLSLKSICSTYDIIHELFVDSRALFDKITTQHEPWDYLLRKTAERNLDAFESGELDFVTLIDVKSNFSDAMAKDSTDLSTRLKFMLDSGLWGESFDANGKL